MRYVTMFSLLVLTVFTCCAVRASEPPHYSQGSTPPLGFNMHFGSGGIRYSTNPRLGSTPPLPWRVRTAVHTPPPPPIEESWQDVPPRLSAPKIEPPSYIAPVPQSAPCCPPHYIVPPRTRVVTRSHQTVETYVPRVYAPVWVQGCFRLYHLEWRRVQ